MTPTLNLVLDTNNAEIVAYYRDLAPIKRVVFCEEVLHAMGFSDVTFDAGRIDATFGKRRCYNLRPTNGRIDIHDDSVVVVIGFEYERALRP